MRKSAASTSLCGIALLLAVVAFSVPVHEASAQGREFVGRIVSISGDRMRVDSRGDKMDFKASRSTRVKGQGKSDWGSLAKGDRVSVSWKMTDASPIAHSVVVMPPRD
jgi:hypothetical protein